MAACWLVFTVTAVVCTSQAGGADILLQGRRLFLLDADVDSVAVGDPKSQVRADCVVMSSSVGSPRNAGTTWGEKLYSGVLGQMQQFDQPFVH